MRDPSRRPEADAEAFDLARAAQAVVGVSTAIPEDAMTASVLGTERQGHGVVIDNGLVLTIGYLTTEAREIWLTHSDGRTVQGDLLGYDQPTGFAVIQALAQLDIAPLPIGSSDSAKVGNHVAVIASGGADQALEARLVAKQEFAGYWEYLLDEAFFTAPAHPSWGGTAVINEQGELIGIGSLQIQDAEVNETPQDLNMVVPIDLLKPILKELRTQGRANRPPRPWLGLYATETDGHVVVIGLSESGPAHDAGMRPGDIIMAVGNEEVSSLAGFYRSVWQTGQAGCDVILSFIRDERMRQAIVISADRSALLKKPVVH